jgi:hypothetical protein
MLTESAEPLTPKNLPREAREGISRVWLQILKEKHPGTSWVLTNDQQEPEQKQQPHADAPVRAAA